MTGEIVEPVAETLCRLISASLLPLPVSFTIQRSSSHLPQVHSQQSRMVHISASPPSALMDEKINIQVVGLKPKQKVTLTSMTEEKQEKFLSFAHFIAGGDGNVSTWKSSSVGGTYRGMFYNAFL